MHYLYVCIVKSVNTGWRIGQYRLTISSIPVGELANTGWRFRQYRRRYIFEDLGRFEVEIEDSKTWRVLELCLDMESSLKKNRFFYFNVPLRNIKIIIYFCENVRKKFEYFHDTIHNRNILQKCIVGYMKFNSNITLRINLVRE